jgi:TonB-linked SusC/RagA family outer membrane protein
MKKTFLIWLLMLFATGGWSVGASNEVVRSMPAEGQVVTGVIKDEKGDLLPGATVYVRYTEVGTISNLDGEYSITVPAEKNELVFSFLGMKSQVVKIDGQTTINVTLEPDIENLEEVVVVGYGTQKRISITGAVSTVDNEELQKSPSMNVATALAGKMPGLVVVQNNGTAGSGPAKISIRGNDNPLILVDGVERDFSNLDMDEIKTISILKDASATAVYGIRGANGVIIVTTNRGRVSKPKFSFKANYGLIVPGDLPELMNSYQYALLKNEGAKNDNPLLSDDELPFSADAIEHYRLGDDPLFYPSTDYYKEVANDYGSSQRYTMTSDGGTERMKYFVSLGYNRERDIYKDFDVGYDDRSYAERYNIRTNLDFDLSKTTKLNLDMAGQLGVRHKPNHNLNDLQYDMFRTPPMAYAGIIDGKIVQTDRSMENTSVYDKIYDNGYNHSQSSNTQISAELVQKLNVITDGLSFRAKVSYDNEYTTVETASRDVPVYFIAKDAEDNTIFEKSGIESKLGEARSLDLGSKKIRFRSQLNYSREIYGGHNVSALAVFTASSKSFHSDGVGSSSENYQYKPVPYKYLEGAARITYNYKEKYFIEGNAGYNGSENFAADQRYGFFPAASAGWVLTNEKWYPDNKVLSYMKFRYSYGKAGKDDLGGKRFFYFSAYEIDPNGGYYFGNTASSSITAYEAKVGNPNVTWETSTQQNFGLESKWLENRLNIDFDLFKEQRVDILMEPNSVPGIIGAPLPAGNIGKRDSEGFEVQMGWKDNIGKVNYWIRANYNYADNKIVFMDEVPTKYPWLTRTGLSKNQIQGLEFVGFYSQDDIDQINAGNASQDNPASGYTDKLQAGDLKYRDLNGDFMVDDNDRKWFENTNLPKTTFSLHSGVSWKNWSVDLLFYGVTDVTYSISDRMRMPFFNGYNNGMAFVMGRWTPETAETATFPRVSATTGQADHNSQSSDFWFRDASYIRLKNAEIAYKLKSKWLKKNGVSSARIYCNGSNLLTWTDLEFVDPEAKSGSTAPIPPNKVFNVGVQMTF